MTTTETFTGVTGITRPFREYLQGLHLQPGDQIVYYGCVHMHAVCRAACDRGTGLHYEQVFVPYPDEAKVKNSTGLRMPACR